MTLQFTVEHDHTVFVDAGEEQLIGNIYFTVQTRPGDFQVRDSGAPTPRTISLPRRTAYLGPDGHLYKDETSGEPFRLVANDPAYNLDHITYRADFELTTLIGESIPVRHCYFPAPSTDTTLYLTRAMVDPDQIVMAVRAQCYAEDILDAGALGAVMVTLNTAAEIRAALGIDLIDLDEWEWLANFAAFPVSGATGIVYGDLATGALWRWNGSIYTPATQDMALRTHLATSKTTPVDADEFPLVDTAASNVLKKVTIGDLKTTLDGRFQGYAQAAKNPEALVTGVITVDGNDLLTSAVVAWPDGSPGTLTITSRDANSAVLAYNITYGSPVTKTYTQPTITRNANGAATNVPAIVVT